jgi:hypothetical protein
MEAKAKKQSSGTVSESGRDASKLRRPFDPPLRDGGRQMIHKANRPPSPEELKQLLIMAFGMGMVVASAYFILFVVK